MTTDDDRAVEDADAEEARRAGGTFASRFLNPPDSRKLPDALEQAALLVERLERAYPLLDPERLSVAISLEDETGRASITLELDNTDGDCGIPNADISMLGYPVGLRCGAAGDSWADWTSELAHADVLLTVYMPGQALTWTDRVLRLTRQYKPALLVFMLGAGAGLGAAAAIAARRALG